MYGSLVSPTYRSLEGIRPSHLELAHLGASSAPRHRRLATPRELTTTHTSCCRLDYRPSALQQYVVQGFSWLKPRAAPLRVLTNRPLPYACTCLYDTPQCQRRSQPEARRFEPPLTTRQHGSTTACFVLTGCSCRCNNAQSNADDVLYLLLDMQVFDTHAHMYTPLLWSFSPKEITSDSKSV